MMTFTFYLLSILFYITLSVDTDGDGIRNKADNCPTIWNPNQIDSNNDGTGDICSSRILPSACNRRPENAFKVLITNVADQQNQPGRKCYTWSIDRLFPNQDQCNYKTLELLLGACNNDLNKLNHYDIAVEKGQGPIKSVEVTGTGTGITINFKPKGQGKENRDIRNSFTFTICMNDIFANSASNFIRFEKEPSEAGVKVTYREAYTVGLLCIDPSKVSPAANAAVGNGENLDVKKMEHTDAENHDEAQKWINIVLIAIGSILLIFGIVTVCICYKQRERKVENKRQTFEAMRATMEHEMEGDVNMEMTEQNTEIVLETNGAEEPEDNKVEKKTTNESMESSPNYDDGFVDTIR